MKIIILVKKNIYAMLSIKTFFIIILIFIFHFLLTFLLIGDYEDSIQLTLILYFFGPNSLGIYYFKWLIYMIPIILIISHFLDNEFKERSLYILPRIGNINTWINGLNIAIFLVILIYFFVGYFITILFSKVYIGNGLNDDILDNMIIFDNYSFNQLAISSFILILLSTYTLILMNTILIVLIKDPVISFSIIMIVMLSSILLGNILPILNKLMPVTQGLLIKHNVEGFTILWSYMYIIIFNLLLIILQKITLKKNLEKLFYS